MDAIPTPLFSDNFYQNPYPAYVWLRDHDPVHWCESLGAWLVTRYDDVLMVLKDFDRFSNTGRQLQLIERLPQDPQVDLSQIKDFYRQGGLINADPPIHTRLRRMLQRALTPRAVERMRERAQLLVGSLIDRHIAAGQMEIIRDLARPLPYTIIAEMLGTPESDRHRFGVWADEIHRFLSAPQLTLELASKGQDAILQMRDYFRSLFALRRSDGQQDLLTALAATDETGDALSEQELLATCQNLLLAGQNTTIHLIANTLLLLLMNPEQCEMVIGDPSLVDAAIEESLRFEGSAPTIRRVARCDIELHGHTLRKGQPILASIGAANRDPAVFERPEEFNIRRDHRQQKHIAFGIGAHYCIGAPLARLEASVAIGTLLRRLPDMNLAQDTPLHWRHTWVVRALDQLPVTFAKHSVEFSQ